jgi:hypothetical protein
VLASIGGNPEAVGSNPLVWRDSEKPSDILKAVVQRRNMGNLVFPDRETIKIGERVFKRSFFPQRAENPQALSSQARIAEVAGSGIVTDTRRGGFEAKEFTYGEDKKRANRVSAKE